MERRVRLVTWNELAELRPELVVTDPPGLEMEPIRILGDDVDDPSTSLLRLPDAIVGPMGIAFEDLLLVDDVHYVPPDWWEQDWSLYRPDGDGWYTFDAEIDRDIPGHVLFADVFGGRNNVSHFYRETLPYSAIHGGLVRHGAKVPVLVPEWAYPSQHELAARFFPDAVVKADEWLRVEWLLVAPRQWVIDDGKYVPNPPRVPQRLLWQIAHAWDDVSALQDEPPTGEPVYLWRDWDTFPDGVELSDRSPTNGVEIDRLFDDLGFRRIDPIVTPVMDVIRAVADAPVVAGLHGAQMAHILWANRDATCVELVVSADENRSHRALADLLDLRMRWVVAVERPEGRVIDLEQARQALAVRRPRPIQPEPAPPEPAPPTRQHRAGHPLGDTMLDDIDFLRSWRIDRVVRAYAHQALLMGSATTPSGRAFVPYAVRDQFVLLDPAHPTDALVTSGLGTGYDLRAAVIDGRAWDITSTDDPQRLDAAAESRLAMVVDVARSSARRRGARRTLTFGNPNFAHVLWNELPTLVAMEDDLAQLVDAGDLQVIVYEHHRAVVDALGGMNTLLPTLGPLVSPHETAEVGVECPTGSTLVTDEVQRRVHAALGDRRAAMSDEPLLWLSVRVPPRSPENQVDFVAAVARRWEQEIGGSVVIDGFSPASPEWRQIAGNRLAATDALVAQAVEACRSRGVRAVRDTRGLDLRECLELAGTAAYYVSPEGTTQHKIGWVWNRLGVVHIGPRPDRDAAVEWHALQVEGGVLPSSLPIEYVADAVGIGGLEAVEDRDIRYVVADSDAAAERILQTARDAGALAERRIEDSGPPVREDDAHGPGVPTEVVRQVVPAEVETPAVRTGTAVRAQVHDVTWHSATPLDDLTSLVSELRPARDADPDLAFAWSQIVRRVHSIDDYPLAVELLAEHADNPWFAYELARFLLLTGSTEQVRLLVRQVNEYPDRQPEPLVRQWIDVASRLSPLLAAHVGIAFSPLPADDPWPMELAWDGVVSHARAEAIARHIAERSTCDLEDAKAAVDWLVDPQRGPAARFPVADWYDVGAFRPQFVADMVERIETSLRAYRGFSVVRLGDGEGALLLGERPALNEALGRDANGDPVRLSAERYQEFIEQFASSIAAADIVGVPDLAQCIDGPPEAWKVARAISAIEPIPGAVIGGWHLHWALEDSGVLRRLAPRVDGFIGPASPAGLSRYGLRSDVTVLRVPGEAWFYGDDPGRNHFEHFFPEIMDYPFVPGQLWLVGAGFLGKLYCGAIRAAGAVAVDVGSLADVWAGRQDTRGEARMSPWVFAPYLPD